MSKKALGFRSIVAIGIGGMVGGGIFAVLGLAVLLAGGGTPIAFVLAGIVALLTAYSYSKLSVKFPSKGGTVEFLNQAFGSGILTGSLNVLLWLSYIVMLSLYSFAFGSYGASFFPVASQALWKHILISFSIILFTGLNIAGSKVVGKAEKWIVGIKIAILLLFAGVGLFTAKFSRMSPSTWGHPLQLLAGGMIIFLAYEGFELIANSAADARNPKKTLPKAYYLSVIFVIILYVLISIVAVGNLGIQSIISAKDYALAAAAQPFLGHFGFVLIAIAALLSTGSAINATLYGSSKISYVIAKDGELPVELEEKIWNKPIEGLFITAGLTLLIANLFNLSSISIMGSAGFLLIFAAVNLSNVKLHKKTNSKQWISGVAFIVCILAFAALVWQTIITSPSDLIVLIVMVGLAVLIESIYRGVTGRIIITPLKKN